MRISLMALLAAATILAGCGSSGSGDSGGSGGSSSGATAGAVKATKVDIKGFKYAPKEIEVKKGAAVTFTNDDDASHTATQQGSQTIDTGRLMKGQSKKLTFKKAGTFNYYCVYHPFMKGKVKVD